MAPLNRRQQRSSRPRQAQAGQVRIIAGQWRGRKLPVVQAEGLRPTGDRVRETLFNWLQADISGAHCLDLFAGTGALGFEAMSRYAASVTFVESDTVVRAALQRSAQQLGLSMRCNRLPDNGEAALVEGDAEYALSWLGQCHNARPLNIVFVDPPFALECQQSILEQLGSPLLADGALVYVEGPVSQALPGALSQWVLLKEKSFSDVTVRLLRYVPS